MSKISAYSTFNEPITYLGGIRRGMEKKSYQEEEAYGDQEKMRRQDDSAAVSIVNTVEANIG